MPTPVSDLTLFPVPDGEARVQTFEVPDACLCLVHGFLDRHLADRAFVTLERDTNWVRERIHIGGREVEVPRLVAWHGDPGSVYVYSGVRHEPEPLSPLLSELRGRVEQQLRRPFNSVLLNLYRDGTQSVGWHSDDEPGLGERPTIASLSLGAERPFQMKHLDPAVPRLSVPLPHGSLFVMGGDAQRCWRHQLPKRVGRNAPGARINLTFRQVSAR